MFMYVFNDSRILFPAENVQLFDTSVCERTRVVWCVNVDQFVMKLTGVCNFSKFGKSYPITENLLNNYV